MTDDVPTRAQCLRASSHLKLQHISDRKGDKRWPVYSVSLHQPHIRNTGVGRGRTSGSIDGVTAGAMLIAADMSVRDMNAACARASQLLAHWLDLPDAPTYSAVVADRALRLLRAGWRRKAPDAVRAAAEQAAERTARWPLRVYRDAHTDEDTAAADDAAWAAEANARFLRDHTPP